MAFKEALVEQVKSKEVIVVCDGVDERILPNLRSAVPKVNFAPIGPHPCGSYEVSMREPRSMIIRLGMPLFAPSCRFGVQGNPCHRCCPLQS